MKLSKKYYYNKNGERMINCYSINIPKNIVEKANIKDNDRFIIEVKNHDIIIRKIGM